MAEMAVSFAREKLLQLRDAANLLGDIPKEFADIYIEIEFLQAFLQDAAGDNADKATKAWMKKLMEASFRIEDVIDEYMMYVEQQPHALGCAALLCECDITHFIHSLKRRHQISSEIRQIKSFVHGIKQKRKDYHFQIQSVQWIAPRLNPFFLDDDEVVGFEGPRDELIGWLVDGPAERTVISVVGMGLLGKTTLVSRVFINKKVIAHFDYHAWITVSQSYIVEGLLRDLLNKLCKKERVNPPQGISEMDQDSLIKKVRSHLQQKRYVVIFDDVWSVDFWGQIENAMLDNNNGSRILITTRRKDVVHSCKNSPFDKVHELKPLTFEKSMKLFCKKAFQFDYSGRCPDYLMNISSEIVTKCRGLPLAIVAIGGLLSSKENTTRELKKLNQNLSLEMEKNPHLIFITRILGFSYDDLPYYLRSCLLYFGIYPKDHEVKSTRLIRQWIAEGFVKDEARITLEEVAQQYLTELIDRSLVQVSSFTIDGKARSCRVHGLLHDMILRKCKDLSFCQHISKEDESVPSGMIRRLSIAANFNDLMGSTESSHIRSLLVFGGEESALTKSFVQRIPTKCRLLKVLDFEDAQLYFVPENLGYLAHLKYLSLRHARIVSLPKFIRKLQNLETLDIRDTTVSKMPKEICKLRKLRHLLGDDMELFELKNGLGRMTSLQTLHRVKLSMDDDDDDGAELIRELAELKQLRNLGLTGVKEEQGRALCSSINEMKNLEKLYIESKSQNEVIDLPDISPLHKLQKQSLVGKLNKFPEWVPQLQNLVQLTLRYSKLTNDPLKSLKNMPHLLFLEMNDAYRGESLYFEDGGFQQLREQSLRHLYNLESIIIEKGALHSLENFQFRDIPKLKTIPPGIQHLEKRQVLAFIDTCIAPDEGTENPVIQHEALENISTWRDRERETCVIHH